MKNDICTSQFQKYLKDGKWHDDALLYVAYRQGASGSGGVTAPWTCQQIRGLSTTGTIDNTSIVPYYLLFSNVVERHMRKA